MTDADNRTPTVPRVGALYVLRETGVRCVVRVDAVATRGDFVDICATVLPSELHAGFAVPDVGQPLTLGHRRGHEGVTFRLHSLEAELARAARDLH